MTSRNKPTAGFWITVALVAELVGYPLSFGPACWYVQHRPQPYISGHEELPDFYMPIGTLVASGPDVIADAVKWYARLWIGDGIVTVVPCFGRGWAMIYP